MQPVKDGRHFANDSYLNFFQEGGGWLGGGDPLKKYYLHVLYLGVPRTHDNRLKGWKALQIIFEIVFFLVALGRGRGWA